MIISITGGYNMQELSIEIENYLTVCRDLKGLSPLTLKAYRIDLKQFNGFMQQNNYLSKECIVEYIDLMHSQYKPKSVKRKIACIKAFYHYMEMENIISINPFHKIQIKYKEPTVLPKTIPIANIESILKYAYVQYNNAISDYQKQVTLRNVIVLELLFSTGMRVSEVSNLKINNIDLKSNNIYIFGKGSKERIMCIANKRIANLINDYLSVRVIESENLLLNKLGNN